MKVPSLQIDLKVEYLGEVIHKTGSYIIADREAKQNPALVVLRTLEDLKLQLVKDFDKKLTKHKLNLHNSNKSKLLK